MIRLGLRLTLNGGREAAVRLVLITAAVALGVGLLLISLAGINGVSTQNAKYGWFNSAAAAGATTPVPSKDPLWWLASADFFANQTIGRVDVAATGPTSPVPPGIAHLPGPGQYYASPSLAALLRTTPASQLAGRFPGHLTGTIGPAALPSPNSLFIIVGRTSAALAHTPGAARIYQIFTTAPNGCSGSMCIIGTGIDPNGIHLILAVVAVALLFPVLIFIATATRLAAARREQRFAAMRLVGAIPKQVSIISAVESTVAAAIGVAAGFGLFFLFRAPLARLPFTGAPFFTSDLSLNVVDIVAVVIAVPAAAAVVARLALRRVQISPLGVTRRVTPRPPRAWQVIPLLAGLAELGYFVVIGRPVSTNAQIYVFLAGFLLIMVGLIVAGPWLTMAGARLMAQRARRPGALIAARRLADNPRMAFRAVSGLVLALFVTTVSVIAITSYVAYNGVPRASAGADNTVNMGFSSGSGPAPTPAVKVPNTLAARLKSIPGVESVVVLHNDPFNIKISPGELGLSPTSGSVPTGLVVCHQLPRIEGHCPAGAQVVAIPEAGVQSRTEQSTTVQFRAKLLLPAAPISVQRLQDIPAQSINVLTNGSTAAIEQARTILNVTYPAYAPGVTGRDIQALNTRLTRAYEQLADVMILASLPIAGCTLAVSVVGGLTDRKRPFSLLRLSGAPLGILRRVVTLETAVPLLTVAVVSTGLGCLAAELFLKAQLGYSIKPPGPEYYVIVAAGLAASLGIIAATFPLLNRITGPEVARNE